MSRRGGRTPLPTRAAPQIQSPAFLAQEHDTGTTAQLHPSSFQWSERSLLTKKAPTGRGRDVDSFLLVNVTQNIHPEASTSTCRHTYPAALPTPRLSLIKDVERLTHSTFLMPCCTQPTPQKAEMQWVLALLVQSVFSHLLARSFRSYVPLSGCIPITLGGWRC